MPDVRHVLHCDLINYNALVHDHCISGVIDWGCALYGDFVYELAWFEFWFLWYPQWNGISVAYEARAYYRDLGANLTEFEQRILCYQIHIGLTHQIYNASIGQWGDLAEVTALTTALSDKVR